jgi:gas vesicle protein
MAEKSGYFGGLVTGLIFGGVAALLLAPKKGEELRGDLSQTGEKLKDRASSVGATVGIAALDVKDHSVELLNSVKEKGAALKDEAVHHIEDVKSTVASAAGDVKTEVHDAAHDAKAAVTSAHDEVQDAVEDAKDGAQETIEDGADAAEDAVDDAKDTVEQV